MTMPLAEVLLATFLVFCRIGGCLLVAPGFSSQRVPVRVRLFLAVALSLALTPLLIGGILPALAGAGPWKILSGIVFETLTGLLIGFLARLFFFALESFGIIIAQSIGFGNLPGVPYDGEDASPTLASLFTVSATAFIFITDQHWELVRGLTESYQAMPFDEPFSSRFALTAYSDQITTVFVLVLRISSPFIIYSIVVNLAMGLTNKLAPAIPVYFILQPLVMVGGVILLMLVIREFMLAYSMAFGDWLVRG